MRATHPALDAARALARDSAALITPVDGPLRADAEGTILLVDEAPDDAALATLAAALPRVHALVMWCEGWDEAEAVGRLGAHGLEHGTVEILGGERPGALCVLVADESAAAALPARLAAPVPSVRALAIMPVFNEADVIHHSIAALVSSGVDVYLIDHECTDDTVAIARPWLGRGLVRIERFPEESGFSARNHGTMVWRDILARVEGVSREVDADWYLFVNADEFRESPWGGVTLRDAIAEVDELGYNAINFEVFDFRPTDDGYVAGTDPRLSLIHYEPGARYDMLQIKAWKRQSGTVDLVGHGGHDVTFADRRVFPVAFLLRHYPIRGVEHGRRKVLAERLPRFSAEERADGWHVQYDHLGEDSEFVHDAAGLVLWDPDRVRAELLSRTLRNVLLGLHLSGADGSLGELDGGRVQTWMTRRGATATVAEAQARLSRPSAADATASPALDASARQLAGALRAGAVLRGDVRTACLVDDAVAALPR